METVNDYYDYLIVFWNKVIEGNLDAKTWMSYYEMCFQAAKNDNEQTFYDAIRRVLETKSKECKEDEIYAKGVIELVRISAYIHRFWIPNQMRYNPDMLTVFELGKKIWIQNNSKDS